MGCETDIFRGVCCHYWNRRQRHHNLNIRMTELAQQAVNAFKIRKVLSKIGDVKLVTIWMTAKRFGNRRRVDENIGDFVSPHFDQAKSDYHHPALHNAPGHQIDDRTPPKGLFEADDFQRWISMRIVENTIADINEALARKFGRRIEGPA